MIDSAKPVSPPRRIAGLARSAIGGTLAGMNATEQRQPGKVAQVRRQLRTLAITAGIGAKLPTVRSLCADLDASVSTVDRAMQDLEAQGILLRRHGSGIYVAPSAINKRMCLLMGSDVIANHGISPIYPALMERIDQVGAERQWEMTPHIVMLAPNRDRKPAISKELVYAIEAGFVDGMISTISFTDEMAVLMRACDIPVSAFLPTVRTAPIIGIAYGDLVATAVAELAALGCRRPALVTVLGMGRRASFHEDLDSFSAAIGRCGLDASACRVRDLLASPLEHFNEATGQRWRDHGYLATRDLLAQADPPDGIVVTDDMAALGVTQALREAGATHIVVASHMNRGVPTLERTGLRLVGLEFDPGYIVDRLLALLDDLFHRRQGCMRTELIQPRVRRDLLQPGTPQPSAAP